MSDPPPAGAPAPAIDAGRALHWLISRGFLVVCMWGCGVLLSGDWDLHPPTVRGILGLVFGAVLGYTLIFFVQSRLATRRQQRSPSRSGP